MRKNTLWVARTAVLIALLITLQFVTKGLGQFVTGSCVNLVLGVSALAGGLWCGVTVALLSPLFAYLLGVAAMPILLVPGVAVGNVVLVIVLNLFAKNTIQGKNGNTIVRWYISALAAAAAKFAVLWLVVVKLLIPLAGLPSTKASLLTVTFTWPQLITALIGGCLAVTIAPILIKTTKKCNISM
jgi:hypothetical protein